MARKSTSITKSPTTRTRARGTKAPDKGQKATDKANAPAAIGLNYTSPPERGTQELLGMYTKSPWMRAIVGKVSKAVANTEWYLCLPSPDAKQESATDILYRSVFASKERRDRMLKRARRDLEVDEIVKHPMLDLIQGGNELLEGHLCMMVTQIYLDMTGEAFWLLEKNGLGMPVQYWPLPTHWVKDVPRKGRPFFTVQPTARGFMEIPATEIIWFKDPNPEDPYRRGSGIGRSLGDEFEIDEYSAKHMKAFFYNRARPDIVISGDNISPEDAKRLEQKWLSDHQGFWRQFKPLFFSRKIDIKELTQNFENIQMVNVRKSERDMFIQVFGAPPEKFGIVNESKRSTIAAADYFWTKDVIQPRMEFIRRTLQLQLVPYYSETLVLDYESPIIQDKEFMLEVFKAQPSAFLVDDWRDLANKNPWPDGKGQAFILPMNNQLVPLEGDMTAVQPGDSPDEPAAPNDNTDEGDDDAVEEENSSSTIVKNKVSPVADLVARGIEKKITDLVVQRIKASGSKNLLHALRRNYSLR